MNQKVPLMLKNDFLADNQIEINLMYAYNYSESILITSPKNGRRDISLSFYRLTYDPNKRACFIDYKIREVKFTNRREVARFIRTMHKVIKSGT